MGAKDMIAGCAARRQAGGCGTRERRDACALLMRTGGGGMLGLLLREIVRAAARHRRGRMALFSRRVEREIESVLERGTIRIDEVARTLGCSRNTLYRRLRAEGTSFEQIRDRLRQKRATAWMREGASVKETAYRLGFSDPAAFSRAFKRWTGRSPKALRNG